MYDLFGSIQSSQPTLDFPASLTDRYRPRTIDSFKGIQMSRKIYAYVKSETCTGRGAVRPGSFVGRNEEPVSRHGDFNPWLDGKRETLSIIARGCADASRYYRYQCARLVAELLDWALPIDEEEAQ